MSMVQPAADTPQPSVDSRVITPCTHCGLQVPKGLINARSSEQFCCSGCRAAYQLIHACGLDDFYSMAQKSGNLWSLKDRGAVKSQDRFADFDQPSFMEKFGKTRSGNFSEVALLLDGIHCAACIWLIEKLPQIAPGVHDAQLNWARQTVRIRWDSDKIQLSQIARTLYQLGYAPHPIRESENEVRRQLENRRHLVRIGIAAAAAGNNMLISTALYLGMFSYMSVDMSQLLRIASCLVGLASLLGPGRVFLQGAFNAVRTSTAHMDLPIALGLAVGSTAGVLNTIRGSGEIYFDSLSVLIFLLLIGRWIQFRQQNRAVDAVEMLYRLTPRTTRKMIDGIATETFVDLVQNGDLLEIRPGDLLPVDAEIVRGTTKMDESILSGESKLQRKSLGDTVLAGTQNRESVVTVRATATGRDTRLSKIVEQVEQASLDKPEVVQWANRIGGYFVITVIVLAAVTLMAWISIDASVAVQRAVALLIVACPCALALATPLAVSVALGRAAKRKILVKGGDVLQVLNRPGIIWLDKTGTLTLGKLQVAQWFGETRWQSAVAALEAKSPHAVSVAIIDFVRSTSQRSSVSHDVDQFAQQPLGGISGRVDSRLFLVGTETLLQSHGVRIDRAWRSVADDILQNELSPCWIAVGRRIVAIAAIGDCIRPDAGTAVEKLKGMGWQVGIMSGDHDSIVKQVALRLGIESEWSLGNITPEEKAKLVRQSMATHNTVVMVGDGVNDSAALAAASVGIAVRNSAEASLAAAPVYLAEEGLKPIVNLLGICDSTGRTIRLNFAASLTYNVFGATLAMIGWINPLVAAILMPISSLTVVAISLSAGKLSTLKA